MNPVMSGTNGLDRQNIAQMFPIIDSPSYSECTLSLRPYLYSSPEKYYQHSVFENVLQILLEYSNDQETLREVLKETNTDISRAFLFLNEANRDMIHEENSRDDMDELRFIDQSIHPSYLRMTEGVLRPFLKPFAYVSRIQRDKSVEGLDIHNIMDEISRTPLADISSIYRSVLRNGIAHGGISYLDKEIRYHDKKGNEEKYSHSEVINIFDELIDLCNGIACAYRIFYLTKQPKGWITPHQISIDVLHQETSCAWWSIEACVPSERAGLNQLAIYAKANTHDYSKVFVSAIQTGILAEYFIPGYDRYFLSIKAKMANQGWAGFDGKRLRELRQDGCASIDEYKGTLENDLVFYIPRPKLPLRLSKINSWLHAFRANKSIVYREVREQLDFLSIQIRDAQVHRNLWGVVLESYVHVSNDFGELSPSIVRKNVRRILKKSLKHARNKLFMLNPVRYLPIGHARVHVFQNDYRIRRLRGFGLGEDLIGVIQSNYISRIKTININGGIVDSEKRQRIVWNRAWYEKNST